MPLFFGFQRQRTKEPPIDRGIPLLPTVGPRGKAFLALTGENKPKRVSRVARSRNVRRRFQLLASGASIANGSGSICGMDGADENSGISPSINVGWVRMASRKAV